MIHSTVWKSYRKTFFSEAELQNMPQSLSGMLSDLKSNYIRRDISDVEFVAGYIFLFLKTFHAKDPRQGKHKLFELQKDGFFADFINRQIRSIPQQVNDVLYNWHLGKYPLRLLFYVPTLEEVLQDQANGVRCVTCLTHSEELAKHVEHGRDPLSFCLHDLRHAHHFFSSEENMNPQIGYSRWMLTHLRSGNLDSFFENKEFKSAWEYGATDMNTHPAHLLKYTKAVADIHLMPDETQALWQKLIPDAQIRGIFEKLNTQNENEAVLKSLISWLNIWKDMPVPANKSLDPFDQMD